jgi:hypothetical protein
MGLERQLMQRGYSEVDVRSLGLSFCILQYTKGKECLQCKGSDRFLLKIKKKYAGDLAVTKVLNSDEH